MSFSLTEAAKKFGLSEAKYRTLTSIHQHVYPGRVDRLLDGGIDFVPERREGYRYWDADGRELIDLHINGGTFNLGHKNPDILAALETASKDWDIGNHHFPSAPKAALAEALIASCPGPMQYVVFCASGSEANDVAIKSARYATGRRKIVALECAYHGRTGLSGTAGDDETARYFHSAYPDEFIKVPFNDLEAMARALQQGDVALVMMETIPATEGFPIPAADYLPEVKSLCAQHGTLFLADEVQTGLGRSGKPWAIEHWGVEPNLLVTGKGLSGGVYPMSAVVMQEAPGTWLQENGWGHVSTFGGSDVGCFVALKALELSTCAATLDNVQEQARYLRAGLDELMPRFPFFQGIRQQGLIFGLKFADGNTGLAMMKALYENGIWAIAAGFDESVIQFKPGLLVDRALCDEILTRFENACIWLVNNMDALIFGTATDEDSPELRQIKDVATEALTYWGCEGASLELLKHRENSVYKVTEADGALSVLRLHRPNYHDDAALRSESMWAQALNDSGIECPQFIPTPDGEEVVTVSTEQGARQCTRVTWLEGTLFNDLGRVEAGVVAERCTRYEKLGALAARLHNQSEAWTPPPGFTRHSWDSEKLLGEAPLWGRFWEHPVITPQQRKLMQKSRIVLQGLLKQLGQSKDVYGLIHADFLPDNILAHEEHLYLIDFDDCGYGWHLFEIATSLFPLINEPYFDEVAAAYVKGYRSERAFAEEHLEILPAFMLIRGLTYLGWLMTRSEAMPHSDMIARAIADGLCGAIPELLEHLNPVQRLGVEVLSWTKR